MDGHCGGLASRQKEKQHQIQLKIFLLWQWISLPGPHMHLNLQLWLFMRCVCISDRLVPVLSLEQTESCQAEVEEIYEYLHLWTKENEIVSDCAQLHTLKAHFWHANLYFHFLTRCRSDIFICYHPSLFQDLSIPCNNSTVTCTWRSDDWAKSLIWSDLKTCRWENNIIIKSGYFQPFWVTDGLNYVISLF